MNDSGMNPMDLPAAAAWQRSLRPLSEQSNVDGAPGLLGYIKYEVGLDRAFAVASLLVPVFVELRGCVLLRDSGTYSLESFEQWWTKLDGDSAAIETLLNRVQLWDLFNALDDTPLTGRAVTKLGRTMATTWEAALLKKFPERRFAVEMRDDQTTYGPTVGFHSLA